MMRAWSNVAFRQALAWRVVRHLLLVAVLVGALLNAINRGDTLLTGGRIDWLKVALTFLVPYFVATFSAYNAYLWGITYLA